MTTKQPQDPQDPQDLQDLQDPQDPKQPLSILNDPPVVLDGPQLLHQLIRWEQHSESCALDFTSNETRKRYSFRDLQSCISALQAQIQASLDLILNLNLNPSQRNGQHVIPVLLPQSPGLYISQLATLQSGGAFCPINLDAPKDRIKFVVGDVSASIIITTPEFKDVVSWEDGPTIILVDEFPDVAQQQVVDQGLPRDAAPDDIAYVMYTSGSSGTPKGVAVSHMAVTQSLLAHERHIPKFDRFLQFAAPSFDVSVFEIFFPLVRGATLVGVNRIQLLNDLPGTITDLEIDAAELTPTVVGSLLQKRSNAPGLKLLLTIGEMLTWPIVKEFGGSETQANMLYGMYGPTEAAIHCTIYPKMAADTKPGNIGIPFDTVSTFVAAPSTSVEDAANLKFLPVGDLGELILGGPQLAQGYLNREEQNKAAFVHFDGKKYYRTGDKARQLEDGTIEILGRISAGQVKLRGQRIELGEIEEVIYKHPGLKTVVAVVLQGRLVVFALVADAKITTGGVLETCAKWLPTFMVPSEIVLLQNFPYLPSGKVDKRRLEADYQAERTNSGSEFTASETETQLSVRTVLQETLGNFSRTTRLAAAGLDSLMAIRVASKLRLLGFNVNTVKVLQAEVFESLVDLCDRSKSTSSIQVQRSEKAEVQVNVQNSLNGHAKDVESTSQCTPTQSAMLLSTAISEKAYRNWVDLDLPGITDVEDVFSALHELAARNPILRTGFAEPGDQSGYLQIIWKDLEESQIELVEALNYEYNEFKDASLHRPIRFQIQKVESHVKLLMHIHHALYDAWSLELLLDDLNTILSKKAPPVRPPFTDVVDSYHDSTSKADDWTAKDYWKDHLALLDNVPVPNFNTGEVPPPSLAVERLQTSMSTSEVVLAARRMSARPQSLFQAAYALVLSSYLGCTDICFGTVFSGRTLPITGIEDIIGPCLIALPVRVDISTSTNLRGLVQELDATTGKHMEHSTLPARDIKAAGGISPRQMLFDTLVIWQQTLHSHDHKRDHVVLVEEADNAEFKLTLDIIPSLGNVELKAIYQRASFPESQVRSLLLQIEQLVRAVIEEENTTLDTAFQHLEKHVLSIENEKPHMELRIGSLSSPVEDLAISDPDRPAIEFATAIDKEIKVNRISYSGLNSYSNQIGHYLLEQNNVLPDELICTCMEKSIDLYASILAAAKIGAGYLPLTPDIPSGRLQNILQEANVKVVIAQSSSKSLFESIKSVEILYIDQVKLSSLSTSNIPLNSTPDMVSYCVFTSGSTTGTPKGVLVTQGNLLSNLDVLQDMYPASKNARFLQSCPQTFGVSVFEIFFAWRVGGTICSAIKDVLFQDIENAIRLFNVTHLSLTPTVAAMIDPNNVPQIEFLVTAGEAVTPKVFNTWADRGLWQGYGPSETTNICTINPRVSKHDAINNIGPPLKNTSAFVLAPGPEFILVPRGGVGELCFGGSQVFRGYMDRDQGVGNLIEHPQFGRLYRSGDFGRLMPDGSLVFTGRKDDQFKIQGRKIELGEINNTMLRSDKVVDCVTMVIDGEGDSPQRLICFWTSGKEQSISLEPRPMPPRDVLTELFRNLDAALPPYMVPSALIPLSFMPSTAQGKIDKRRLVKHFRGLEVSFLHGCSQTIKSTSDHTWTGLESAIARSVAETAKVSVEDIGPDTSFFELGIDSINAIQLARSLTKVTGKQVAFTEISKFPSVVRLADRLSFKAEQGDIEVNGASLSGDIDFGFEHDFIDSTVNQFEKTGRTVQRILPCTPLQEAMLSATEASTKKLFDNSVTFNISGDVTKLESCWREMVRRHEILRTCFVSTDVPRHPFVQVVLQDYDLKFGRISSVVERTARGDQEPPYTLDLVESSGQTKLVVWMHHALYDGVALALLHEEVEMLYRSESLPGPVSFAPFLKSMASLDMDKAEKFWQSKLQNCHFPKFSTSNNHHVHRSQENSVQAQWITAKMPLSLIRSNLKKCSTSLLAVCHTAWASLLSERLQETDICFGSLVSGRTLPVPNIDRLVAPCFNTIPTRLQNIHNLSYLEAFRKLQSLSADSLPFQLTPLRRLQSKLSHDGSRLFDTLFILQQPPRQFDSGIWTMEDYDWAMDFPIAIEVVPRQSDDKLEIMLHSYTDVLSEEGTLGLLEAFDLKLHEALQNPRRHILAPTVRDEILAKLEIRENSKAEESNGPRESENMSAGELRLRDVVKDFTDIPTEKIERDISIFRLGLDSISTVQIATRLRKQGHSVLASDILENNTIAKLGAFLSSQRKSEKDLDSKYDFVSFDKDHRTFVSSKLGMPEKNIEAVMPCTSVQQGMLAQTLHSDGLEYVNSVWLEIPGEVYIPALKAAWGAVCENNEVLRTSFTSTENPKHPFVMVVCTKDASQLPWYESSRELPSRAENLLKNPWNLHLYEENGTKTLKFTAHHALYDAQSFQMLFSDVAKTYASQRPTSRPPIASLLSAILQDSTQNIDEKRAFWEKEANKIIVNRFPNLTPLHVSNTASEFREIISQSSSSQLHELCRASGVTIQAATQATWARLLYFYIGETSTTFGMTLSGRSIHEDADQIAFPSIVTLPVRCEIAGTNGDLLTRTIDSNALLHKHQFTPLTSIQKWAGYPEGKIFDTLFAFQKFPDNEVKTETPWKIAREQASVDYSVSFEVEPTAGDKIALRMTFRCDLIPVEQAELLLKQYDALLLDILQNPQSPCDVAPIALNELLSITAAEEDILSAPVTLLHEFVELGAREFPDRKALEFATSLDPENFKSTSWTYRQLDEEANKVASLLLKRKVEPGQMIAICFDKCAEASFTIIGILKAGCSYVALDPNAPADRSKFIVKDSGAELVVTAGQPGQNLKAVLDCETINLDSADILTSCSSQQPRISRNIMPEDVSYCLYTSGTTGTPKGCLITHENAVQFMLAFSRLFEGHWKTTSKFLQFASFHFDVSVMEQFWSWSVGMCVVSAPRDLIFEDITSAIQQLGVTHIDLTPSLARLIHPDKVPTLCEGAFITGGEQLKQEILDVWGEKAVIYNGYGPTEVTIGCTMYPRVPKNGRPSNIGPAYINVGSFVLKPGTEIPVLRGGIGELCVSGKLVGKGYLNRPDLTVERFPTLKAFNKRVYRTGDLVRILHDGSFIFLGRADDQVKLRGQRLELSEINEVIKNGVASIQEVVTLVLKHSSQQKEQLVTFIVADSSSDNEGSLIMGARDACKARLPGYMVPTHFIPLQKLPLNVNNKADSKQLAAMYNEMSVEDMRKLSHAGQDGNSWTGREKRALDIVAKTLQIEAGTLTGGTTIFELGIDSISIIGFSKALQDAGLVGARVSAVKNNPSMRALVRVLLDGDSSDQGRENAYVAAAQKMAAFAQRHRVFICQDLGVESADVESISPCTAVQEGMIYRFLEADDALYFNKFEFELAESVDVKDLKKAWNKVTEQLEVLRMKFVATDDGFAQVVLRNVNERAVPAPLDYERMDKSEALKVPYSISFSGNTMKIQIFHGLYDGNSLTMLLRRVIDEYHGLEEIDYGPSFISSLPYGPLAEIPQAKEFWRSHLQDWVSSPIPSRPKLESSADILATSTISSLAGFDQLRKHLGVTPQALIQASWLSVLQPLANSANLTIGIVTSGRAIDFEDADAVIGPLFNTGPFHVKIERGMSSRMLVKECHEFNIRMQDFQHTPLKDVQRWSPAKQGEALFDTLFVVQRPGVGDDEFAEGIWREIGGGVVADYPLAFEATLSPDNSKLELTIVAQGEIMSQEGADDLLRQVEKALLEMLESSGENVIPGGGSELDGEVKRQTVVSPSTHETPNGPFTWTDEAETIRTEIAILASVSEDSIQEHSSIFELGLDSIDVIKLASRLKKRGIEVPVSVMVKSQTIAMISPNILAKNELLKTTTGKSLLDMSRDLTTYLKSADKLPENVELVLPATPLQQTMVNEMISSGYTRYFNVDGLKLSQDVDLEKLRQAVTKVVEQSPILRTTFVAVEDPKAAVSFAQIIHNSGEALSGVSPDISTLAVGQKFEDFMENFRVESSRLAAEDQQLLQVRFVDAGMDRYLVIAISHALYDGTSLQLIHDDIQKAYNGKLADRPEFMPFLEEVFQSTTEDARKFWRTTLSNLPPAIFPQKLDSRIEKHTSTTRLERRSRVSLPNIEALCKSSRITLQTLGQTCWALVLSQLMGQLDIVFGSVLSCRDTEEASEVMFPLMNTVAVRSVIHGTLSEMLRYMQDMSDTTRQYQHFPLGTAQAYAFASRQDSGLEKDTTLLDTLFIYQGRRQTEGQGKLYESVYGASDVEFPVCVEMEVVNDEYLSWNTACKSIARDANETEGIIDALEAVLQRLVEDSEAQAIVSDADGVSVCGLPKFRLKEKKKRTNKTQVLDLGQSEWTSTELAIRSALHALSGIPEDSIRKDSTIFHLGLDSISVLKLPALLKTEGIRLSVSDIMRQQTVYAMAKASRSVSASAEAEADSDVDVDRSLAEAISGLDLSTEISELEKEIGEVQHVMPATAGEQYMIRQWQVSQGAVLYHTFTYALSGPVDKAGLASAWKTLLKRHDILRTGFIEVGSRFLQVVFKDPPNEVLYQDAGNPATTRKSNSDLRRPPLDLVVEDADGSSVRLQLILHHALYDGISLLILVDELQSLYRGEQLNPPDQDFKTFVAQSLSASSPTTMKERWTSYLGDKPSPLFPETLSSTSHNSQTEVYEPSIAIKPLKPLAQEVGVSVDVLFLAATSKLFARSLQTTTIPSITFGIYLANRAPFGSDLSTLAAPTLNLLPLRVRAPLDRSIEDIAREIQRDIHVIGSKEMVGASLAEIYEWTGNRVNFFVNIIKSSGSDTTDVTTSGDSRFEWRQVQDHLRKKAEVIEGARNERVKRGVDSQGEGAYLPFVDIEIHYRSHLELLNMGVSAPGHLLSLAAAESLVEEFWGCLDGLGLGPLRV
ncbi:uncharacterized protein L3040_004875 [Drepanopeziza brunnea f. sp. 'multigermtubi']|uniref:uncharacterized protein n=1 Tax=Drepanopeziza brunnea f. sp. 'multigermtubi' TaxID=698441 RepID=UPI002383995C|nr:hypothetical protein L3040_004875 [Drepanopeziza brunnea f. sp. 'multigermtubi']